MNRKAPIKSRMTILLVDDHADTRQSIQDWLKFVGYRVITAGDVSVGIGIRIGLPRSPRNLLRIDLAFPMQNDPLGQKKAMISFSSGQAF